MVSINHAPIVARFFGELTAGAIEGVRPMAALSPDVFELYVEWAKRAELPTTSLGWMCRYLGFRYGIHIVRKRYADGAFIRGPHSIMLLAGQLRNKPLLESEVLGRQILEFRNDVKRYIERATLPGRHVPLREPLP